MTGEGVSSGVRSLILGRIRDAVGPARPPAAAEYDTITRAYGTAPTLDDSGRLELFVERLQHYQVGVHRAAPAGVRAAIADTLALRGKARLLVPAGFPVEWVPGGLPVVEDTGLSYEELDGSDGVLTTCSAAIASTGTIVLRHGSGEGRRALTLVPDYHLCVVRAEQIVQTVPEAMRLLEASGPELVTTISGPSATADIEMTRVRGVHGPRTLDVVVVV